MYSEKSAYYGLNEIYLYIDTLVNIMWRLSKRLLWHILTLRNHNYNSKLAFLNIDLLYS